VSEEKLRDALDRHGLWANKGLGQHFLFDLNLTRRIARASGVVAGGPALEIGPGPGGLTRALLEAGANPLIAIERDGRFLPLLDELKLVFPGRLQVIHTDALGVREEDMLSAAGLEGPVPIVSNLPYNVGTPLLVKWLKAGAWRGPMTLMFQKEVAERVVARPGEDAYGRLAVLAQARCTADLVLDVPAQAFTPPPKVASAVVHLVDRVDPYPHLDALEKVTAAAFGQRRKMLRSALKSLAGGLAEPMLAMAGLDPQARAETISPAGFFALTEAWRTLNEGP
jgi:16S rRNA (adenine1518-N6/adenine1519-N6)-dimethyltransferase